MLADAVVHDGPQAKSEASWILGLIGSREAFEALLELSRSESWKLRSSALNAIGKLKDLTPEDRARLEDRIREVLSDTDEVIYVRKDAAYTSGSQGICGLLGLLVGALDDAHYAVRFSAAEAIRDLSKGECEDVAVDLIGGLPDLDAIGTAAALHASQDLPPARKLDVAEAVVAAWAGSEPAPEVALARLLAGIEPETSQGRARLEALRAQLPADSWKTRALLGTE